MTLPAYAEELKRLIEDEQKHWEYYSPVAAAKFIRVVGDNLDRILRDAEIAEATRRHYRALYRATKSSARDIAHDDLYALIAKETP